MIPGLLLGAALAQDHGAHPAAAYDETGLTVSCGDVRLNVQFFGDLTAAYASNPPAGADALSQPAMQLPLFVTVQACDRLQLLTELVAATNFQSLGFSKHRQWASWTFQDALWIKVGAEHNALSRWNRTHHHGRWLEASINRPLLARFSYEGGLLVDHNHGLELGGQAPTRAGALEYTLAISTEPGIEGRRDLGSEDSAEESYDYPTEHLMIPSIDAVIGLSPGDGGLQVGLGGHFGAIPANYGLSDPTAAARIYHQVGTGYVEYRRHRLRVLAEIAGIANASALGGTWWSHSGYAQVEQRVWRLTPYARVDYRRMDQGDPYYVTLPSSEATPLQTLDLDVAQQTLGARLDFTPHTALKLEGSRGVEERRGADGQVADQGFLSAGAQLAWVF